MKIDIIYTRQTLTRVLSHFSLSSPLQRVVDVWACGRVDVWTCGRVDMWTCAMWQRVLCVELPL